MHNIWHAEIRWGMEELIKIISCPMLPDALNGNRFLNEIQEVKECKKWYRWKYRKFSGGSSIALGGGGRPPPPIHIKCRPCHEIAAPPPPTQRARALPTVRNARASRKHTFCVCVWGGGGGGGGNFLKVSVMTKFNLIPEILFNNRERFIRSFEIVHRQWRRSWGGSSGHGRCTFSQQQKI